MLVLDHLTLTTVNRRIALVAVAAIVTTGGCRSDSIFVDMTDSTFIHTMVALRELPVGAIDPSIRMTRRDSILRTFGVTAAQVESTAVRLANNPARASEIWRAIENPPPSSRP